MNDTHHKPRPFDLRDAHFYGGVTLASVGAAMIFNFGAGLIVLGASLAAVALRHRSA